MEAQGNWTIFATFQMPKSWQTLASSERLLHSLTGTLVVYAARLATSTDGT